MKYLTPFLSPSSYKTALVALALLAALTAQSQAQVKVLRPSGMVSEVKPGSSNGTSYEIHGIAESVPGKRADGNADPRESQREVAQASANIAAAQGADAKVKVAIPGGKGGPSPVIVPASQTGYGKRTSYQVVDPAAVTVGEKTGGDANAQELEKARAQVSAVNAGEKQKTR